MMLLATAAAAATMMSAPVQDRAPQAERVAPRGSYAQSCSNAYVNQGRLYADCRDMRGRMRGTSIELSRCVQHEIGNNDGLLMCGNVRGSYEDRPGNGGGWGNGGGNNGGGWGGGGRDSAVIYRDANFRGASMTVRGEIANLQYEGFNDAISSMELRGRWEICTDANFRGYCEVVDGNVRNLDRWGLNDRISSMRPLRGGGRW